MSTSTSPWRRLAAVATALILPLAAACSGGSASAGNGADAVLRISSIPDQDPDVLEKRDGAMAAYLTEVLGVKVEYVPVTDYTASVSLFHSGDLDLVFYGGLTGVQARLQTPGSVLVAQRDIDDAFRSVFIANTATKLQPVDSVAGLKEFAGHRFTFGSETSTSGRLMPEYFLDQAGVSTVSDLAGPPGYSGSHDKTIDLVQSGTYDGGALNVQVWKSRLAAKSVDLTKVRAIFTTPTYHDYHWLASPEVDRRFGAGFTDKIKTAMLNMSLSDPAQKKVLDLYGCKGFVTTTADNYTQIEDIGRKRGLVS